MVKSTIYPDGHLLATLKKKNNPPDKYVLCVGKFPEYKIVGEIGADEFLQDSNIGNLGKGPGFMLTQAELHPIRVSVINIKERYGITNRQKDKT